MTEIAASPTRISAAAAIKAYVAIARREPSRAEPAGDLQRLGEQRSVRK